MTLLLATLALPLGEVDLAPSPELAGQQFSRGLEALNDRVMARKHFRDAATTYDRLWQQGQRSARLAVERGRSHFLAGNPALAVAAFRAGLRDDPTNSELVQGLANIRAAIPYPPAAKPDERLQPDPPGGWQHVVSEWDVYLLALASVGLIAVGLVRWYTVRAGWARPVVAVGGVGIAVCLGLLWQLSAERSVELETRTLVVVKEALLRKGNGLTHLPRLTGTLPPGTELVERGRRGGWVQATVAGGAIGWLPESAVQAVE